MGYLIAQILSSLIVATLLGAMVGALLRSLGVKRRLQAVEAEWRERLRIAERERDEYHRGREEIAARLSTVEQDYDERLVQIRDLDARLEAAEQDLEMRDEASTPGRASPSPVLEPGSTHSALAAAPSAPDAGRDAAHSPWK